VRKKFFSNTLIDDIGEVEMIKRGKVRMFYMDKKFEAEGTFK
jgi:hypothetical protein